MSENKPNKFFSSDSSKGEASKNDLIPAYKIFGTLVTLSIAIKILLQYTYKEPPINTTTNANDVDDYSSAVQYAGKGTSEKSIQMYFKSYIMYSFAIFWAFWLLIVIVQLSFAKYDGKKEDSFVAITTLRNVFPVVLLIAILAWVVLQNITYSKPINSGHAPQNYITFDTGVNILLLLQSILIITYITRQMTNPTPDEDMKLVDAIIKYGPWLSMGLGVLCIVMMVLNEIILKNFVTDG